MKGIVKGFGWFVLYVLLLSLIQQIFVAAGSGADSLQAMTLYMEDHMLVIGVVSNLLVGLALIFLFCVRKKGKKGIKEEWHLHSFEKKQLLYGVILAFSYAMFSSLLMRNQSSVMNEMFLQSSAHFGAPLGFILKVVNLLLLAPIVEEIALRGIVYTRILKSSSAWTAILVSGLLFGMMHFMAGGFVLVVHAAIMGMLLGYLLYRYDSLWVCIAAHMAANLPEFLLADINSCSFPVVLILEAVSVGVMGFCLFKTARS